MRQSLDTDTAVILFVHWFLRTGHPEEDQKESQNMANAKMKTKTDETVPADITDSDFVSGLYKRHGECRFCHTYRMLRYSTDDI